MRTGSRWELRCSHHTTTEPTAPAMAKPASVHTSVHPWTGASMMVTTRAEMVAIDSRRPTMSSRGVVSSRDSGMRCTVAAMATMTTGMLM